MRIVSLRTVFGYNSSMGVSSQKPVTFQVELEREADGRWIAEISQLPGVLAYADTRAQACARVQALALRVVADR